MASKRCSTCGEYKPLDQFNRNRSMADGLAGQCRPCYAACHKRWRRRPGNREKSNKWNHRWRSANPLKMAAIKRRRYHKAPEKTQARNAVTAALREGRLVKEPCERCGSTENIHGHHEDYAKRLDVRWLCRICHHQEHRRAK